MPAASPPGLKSSIEYFAMSVGIWSDSVCATECFLVKAMVAGTGHVTLSRCRPHYPGLHFEAFRLDG